MAVCGIAWAEGNTRPVVGPGATKDDVVDAYGWPNGQSQSGTKEILSYAQGEVILEKGRVERINFSPDVPWQSPRPRPVAAAASSRKATEAPVDHWRTTFRDAIREAQRRRCRILALFTGSDWSPASRRFQEEVEPHPDFIDAFAGDFVFLKLDFPRGSPVPAKIPDENLALRDQYEVTTYPTLLVLSAAGELLARVDLTNPPPADSFRGRVIAAVHDARAASALAAPVVEPPPAPAAPAASPDSADAAMEAVPAQAERAASLASPAMRSAGRLIAGAFAVGMVLVAILWWFLWRQPQPKTAVSDAEIAERIDAAAGGLPSAAEMAAWSRDKLRSIAAGLAEYDNFNAQIRSDGGDVDIELSRRGDVKPRVLVACAAGSDGVVSAKQLRELFGSLAAAGVDTGWFVSPAGFTTEAREYAAAHRIVLVTSEGLHNMMREVPPVSLPRLLART